MKHSDLLYRLYMDAYKARGKPIPGRERNVVVAVGVDDPLTAYAVALVGNLVYPDVEKNPWNILVSGFGVSASRQLLPDTGEIGPDGLLAEIKTIVDVIRRRSPKTIVTADLDHAYGDAREVPEFIKRAIELGIAGFNFEDQQYRLSEATDILPYLEKTFQQEQLEYIRKDPRSVICNKSCGHVGTEKVLISGRIGGGKYVLPLDIAAEKIREVARMRDELEGKYGHVVINARTDVFSTYPLEKGRAAIEDAIRRGNTYLKSGADVIFYEAPSPFIGFDTLDVMRELIKRTHGPVSVNLLRGGRTKAVLTIDDMDKMGAARVSIPIEIVKVKIAASLNAAVMALFGRDMELNVPPFNVTQAFLGWPQSLKRNRGVPHEIMKYGDQEAFDKLIKSMEGSLEPYVLKIIEEAQKPQITHKTHR